MHENKDIPDQMILAYLTYVHKYANDHTLHNMALGIQND